MSEHPASKEWTEVVDRMRAIAKAIYNQNAFRSSALDDLADQVERLAASSNEPCGEPVAWSTNSEWWGNDYQSETVRKLTRHRQPEHGFTVPLYSGQPPGREWQPMTTAPRDQTPVLLLVNDAPGSPLYRAGGLQFVGKWVSDVSEWCFAAPVGYGGIPDAWLLGWMPLPASRPTKCDAPKCVVVDCGQPATKDGAWCDKHYNANHIWP